MNDKYEAFERYYLTICPVWYEEHNYRSDLIKGYNGDYIRHSVNKLFRAFVSGWEYRRNDAD